MLLDDRRELRGGLYGHTVLLVDRISARKSSYSQTIYKSLRFKRQSWSRGQALPSRKSLSELGGLLLVATTSGAVCPALRRRLVRLARTHGPRIARRASPRAARAERLARAGATEPTAYDRA